MMKSYIYCGQILSFSKDISSSVDISADFNEQQTKYIKLNTAQMDFYAANPTASVEEVWNCTLSIQQELTPAQLRQIAYYTEPLIEWQGELLTCDKARDEKMSVYFYSNQTEKLQQLQALWLAARTEIQNRYPEIL